MIPQFVQQIAFDILDKTAAAEEKSRARKWAVPAGAAALGTGLGVAGTLYKTRGVRGAGKILYEGIGKALGHKGKGYRQRLVFNMPEGKTRSFGVDVRDLG